MVDEGRATSVGGDPERRRRRVESPRRGGFVKPASDSAPPRWAAESGTRRAVQRGGSREQDVIGLSAKVARIGPQNLDRAISILLDDLVALLGPGASWVLVARRDESAAVGWRAVRAFYAGRTEGRREALNHWFNHEDHAEPSESMRMSIRDAGTVRVLHNRAEMDVERWEASLERETLRELGMRDRLMAVRPVGERCEVYVGVDRIEDAADFTDDDRRLMGQAVCASARLCRWIGLDSGATTEAAPFTDRERTVLRHLLTGSAEKQIAATLGLRPGSLHQVVVRVFRKLGVRSRAELMARFLAGEELDDGSPTPFGSFP